jgi:hypothetical protein
MKRNFKIYIPTNIFLDEWHVLIHKDKKQTSNKESKTKQDGDHEC